MDISSFQYVTLSQVLQVFYSILILNNNIHQMFVYLNLERFKKNKDGFTDSKNNICARIS